MLVAAVADNGVIGRDGDLPWRIPEDLAHFKRVTLGNTIVMGRKTFDSLGRPLPGRVNVVLTRDPTWTAEGVLVAGGLEQAIALAEEHPGDVMVIGGGELYRAAMRYADALVLTEVHLTPDGDTTFPELDAEVWTETRRERHDGYDFVWRERSSTRPPPDSGVPPSERSASEPIT